MSKQIPPPTLNELHGPVHAPDDHAGNSQHRRRKGSKQVWIAPDDMPGAQDHQLEERREDTGRDELPDYAGHHGIRAGSNIIPLPKGCTRHATAYCLESTGEKVDNHEDDEVQPWTEKGFVSANDWDD